MPGRQCDGEAGRDHGALARCDGHGCIGLHRCDQIEPGRVLALVGRKRQVGAVRQPHRREARILLTLRLPPSPPAMRATSARATSSFDCGGQDSTPRAVTRCTLLRSPPMTPRRGRDVVGHDPVAALACKLCLRMFDDVIGLGREADHQPRPRARAVRHGRQDIGVFNEAEARRSAASLLDLAARPASPPANRRPPPQTPRRRRAAPASPRASISLRGHDLHHPRRRRGSGTLTGPDTSVTSAPAAAAAAAMAWPCLPDERLAM